MFLLDVYIQLWVLKAHAVPAETQCIEQQTFLRLVLTHNVIITYTKTEDRCDTSNVFLKLWKL